MQIECMYCKEILGEKEGQHEVSSSICDPCLDLHQPEYARKVRVYKQCNVCPERRLKCHLIACDGLSEVLDLIDIELKAEGL